MARTGPRPSTAPRSRPRRKTAERGYGGSYATARAAYMASYQPGQPCARCGLPLWPQWRVTRAGRRVSMINLGHTPDRAAYTGLEHEHCNKSEGATRGNRGRGPRRGAAKAAMSRAPLRTSRDW